MYQCKKLTTIGILLIVSNFSNMGDQTGLGDELGGTRV
jgi:hypothetical protein